MLSYRPLMLAIAFMVPAVTQAADPAPLTAERRLSDADIAKVLEKAAERREAVEQIDPPARQVHGVMGVAIGTGGYRSVHGTMVVPILKDGIAAVSFDSTDFGSRGPWAWQGPR